MSVYTSITIIYNPMSTGSGERLAYELDKELQKILPEQHVEIIPTKYAGHAEKLAYSLAKATKRALVISASGDGGYHEVVNGLMQAQQEGASPVAGLLPAGNANDHHRNMHEGDFAQSIKRSRERSIDVLQLSTKRQGKLFERYAHSYIGVGLTPKVAAQLNKSELNRLKEVWIVSKSLLSLRAVPLVIHGRYQVYDSLIFSNIADMSKFLSLSKVAAPDDGKFEVTTFHRSHRLKLIARLLKASTIGMNGSNQVTSFDFETVRRTLIQLDGEITRIDASSEAKITIAPKKLRCIV